MKPPKNEERTMMLMGSGALPSPRAVSNIVFRSAEMKPPKNEERTMMLMGWGQFGSHDISLTPVSRGKKQTRIKSNKY